MADDKREQPTDTRREKSGNRQAGGRADARTDRDGPEGLLTLVCLTCGNEKFFEEQAPRGTVTCERCGGTVFRNFFTPTEPDEATLSQLEETARSTALDEDSPEISADELRDLNNP